MTRRAVFLWIAAAAAGGNASAQQAGDPLAPLARASCLIVPQAGRFALLPGAGAIEIESVEAHVQVLEQAARTTIQVTLRNNSSVQDDAVLLLPVPPGAVVSEFSFQGPGAEPSTQVLSADEARRLYDAIVAKIRDPALLEFAGYNLVRSSVFPVPPQGTAALRLTYEQVLPADGNRVDYLLPRSELLERRRPWTFTADIASARPISAVYSPSHQIQTQYRSPGHVTVTMSAAARDEPGPLRLSWLFEGEGVSATVMACPDPQAGGGYFLLLAGLSAQLRCPSDVKREVTLVIDRSGSMAGPKWSQARAAAMQVLDGLAGGEAFNIIDYSSTVATFAPRPVVKDDRSAQAARGYIEAIRPGGGTNIHDALLEALRQEPAGPGFLPIVLFLTDGLPTIGRTTEADIRGVVEHGNTHGRRVFSFGVGYDVNAPMLDAIAAETRGTSTYVLPQEDIGPAVAGVIRRLAGPVFADPVLDTAGPDGEVSTRLVAELVPRELPDLFEGDQLVLLGQYRSEEPITFRLHGTYLAQRRTFQFTFTPGCATTRHSFVSRLWAGRRIAELVDQIRLDGASVGPADPRRELVDEIVRLSTRFGILTEYTAFLATEGTDLGDFPGLAAGCAAELNAKAVAQRSGPGAVKNAINANFQKAQSCLNYANKYLDEELRPVEVAGVQQLCDLAFFRRGPRWIDSRLLCRAGPIEPDQEVTPGSAEYRSLVERLTLEGREAALSLSGEVLLDVGGRAVLVRERPDC